jgi:hypothetical protein
MARHTRSASQGHAQWLAELRPGLRLLLRAWQFAQDLSESPWNFAVEISLLRQAGLTDNDLRWLLCKQYAEHATEILRPRHSRRTFTKTTTVRFCDRSCFILTAVGADCFLDLDSAAHIPRPTRIHAPCKAKPVWDPILRELRFQGQIVKRFRVPAPNQERILSVFQEERWPPRIDDPLPPADDIDPKKRLNAVIQSLNRCQINPLIHFGGNGEADGVVWEFRTEKDGEGQ